MALPTATFDPTKVVIGRQGIIAFTPTGGTATNLLVNFVSHNPGLQTANYQAPGASNGAAFTAATWVKGRNETMKFKTKEIKKIVTLLGSLSDLKNGAAIVYIRDVGDTTTVALMTDSFNCCLYIDSGDEQFSGDNPTEIDLVLESHKDGPITFTNDGTP